VYSQMMKWVSIAALLVAVVFWNSAANYQRELSLVVSVAAAVVLAQAFQVKKYRWAACFPTIAVLFNPAVPVFRFAGGVGFVLVCVDRAICDLVRRALRG
jgi:hypothetical protein